LATATCTASGSAFMAFDRAVIFSLAAISKIALEASGLA
jgi:hypothetical protein